MKDFQRLMIPLLIIIGSAFLQKLVLSFTSEEIILMILRIVIAFALFWLGFFFNPGKSNKAVFRKVIAIVFFVFLLCMEMGWLFIPFVSDVFAMIGIEGLFFSLLYIYCGYLYNDK